MCSLEILYKSQQELVEKEFHRSDTWRLRECTFLLNRVRDKEARWNTCFILLFVYFDCCLFFFSTFLWWSWNHLAQFANQAAVAWWWTNLSFLATVLDLLRDSDFPCKLLWGGVDGRSNSSRILRKKPNWLTLRFNGDSPWDVVIRAILDLGCSPFLSGSDAANPFSLVQQSVEVVHTTRPTHLVHTRIQRNSLSWWSSVAEYDQPLLHNAQLSTENRIDVCHQVVRACCVLLKNSAISLYFCGSWINFEIDRPSTVFSFTGLLVTDINVPGSSDSGGLRESCSKGKATKWISAGTFLLFLVERSFYPSQHFLFNSHNQH